MEGNIADVRCPNCGAPARYDIIRQRYLCAYCGSQTGVKDAILQKQGFRQLQQKKIVESRKNYKLMDAQCPGCGARIIFEENEAMSNCAFCGNALVRKEYLKDEELPEMIVPFRISEKEAVGLVEEWCERNAMKPEARHLKTVSASLKGFYLPYELITGPVNAIVERMDASRSYYCEGFVDDVFVNCSKQLDNRVLDATEPFELDELKEFDFAYAAGQRIKIKDINKADLERRVAQEVAEDYAPIVRKTLETEAVEINTGINNVLRMPALLPIYFVNSGNVMAAVNGQTGKVSVRAEKDSHYYFLPWWLKALASSLIICGIIYLAFRLFGMDKAQALYIDLVLAAFMIIVTLCAYDDFSVHNSFRVTSERKIYTSKGGPLHRENRKLVKDDKEIRSEVMKPVFFEKIDGEERPVEIKFTSPLRILETALLALFVLFLPVIIALFLNGFDFKRLELGGSAVWFCIMVPVIPIYILKFEKIELYERPWIYLLNEDGTKKRYHQKIKLNINKNVIGDILRALFIPPVSLAVWFGILCFCVMCYLTAFGFE
ncbi:MAG: hypothetical protein IJI92_00950 [Erysipelotrichaceae bacterium]|nr:hypothetical protein [Erysipelotrichaceae bacterium]